MKNDNRSRPQPIQVAAKEEFQVAYSAAPNATNIYDWDGEIPKPGYYRQGGTLIEIFERPDNGVIGTAVQG